MQRGEIWWASLPTPVGAGPGYHRPVLIVQADPFNRSAIRTVIVAVITTNLRLADAPGNVALPRRKGILSRKSVVNVSQLLTIDRSYLTERVGRLPNEYMREVDAGLQRVLAL